MIVPQSDVPYSLAQINFKFDIGLQSLTPCSFIGCAVGQEVVFQKLHSSGFCSYIVAKVNSNGIIDSNTFSFDDENKDYYFSVRPFSKVDNTYLCENTAFEKDTGRTSKTFSVIIIDRDYDDFREVCYLNSELVPTHLISTDLIALDNGGIVSIREHNQQDKQVLGLQEIFGLEMTPEEFSFHGVRMDKSLTAVISVALDDTPIDSREFIRVKVGEYPVALRNFYSLDRELGSKLIGPQGEVFWGTLSSKQFSPMLWSKSGIAQALEVPSDYQALKIVPVGISKSTCSFGIDHLIAYFKDAGYCHPVAWYADPMEVGEIPKLKSHNIVLNDMGSFVEIHDVCEHSGLLIATILPFGSSTPKKCILAPEIKI